MSSSSNTCGAGADVPSFPLLCNVPPCAFATTYPFPLLRVLWLTPGFATVHSAAGHILTHSWCLGHVQVSFWRAPKRKTAQHRTRKFNFIRKCQRYGAKLSTCFLIELYLQWCYWVHFRDEDAEAQRGELTSLARKWQARPSS